MRSFMKMRLHLWFIKTSTGFYKPNQGLTASFLVNGLTGIESPERLNSEEFEYLKSVRKQHGLILHVDDGDNTETFDI
jgi:hypothetical protein